MSYCPSRQRTIRRPTIEVRVGSVGIGASHPIRIQSMTTSDTQDVQATIRQSIALAEVGCEIIRVTAPNAAAARCLREIRSGLSAAGFSSVPLVADIHFLPQAAMEAVEHVEKVRINPGNYADRKKFAVREYSDFDYERELERLHQAFAPLVLRCRQLGRAMRIGTNHGSLSDRIMNRYGDTPLGMVESALEFIRISRSCDYHALVLSMKASNPKVMIQAYRLLAARMEAEDMHYPLHLGVTEAGDGEDGRIKSAIGIGSLLLDGLGDTIRVSLTEDSVFEIPVARDIASKAMSLWSPAPSSPAAATAVETSDPFRFSRRPIAPLAFGPDAPVATDQPPRVIIATGPAPTDPATLAATVRSQRNSLKDTPIEGLLVSASSASELGSAFEIAAALTGEVQRLIIEVSPELPLPSHSPAHTAPLAFLRAFTAEEVGELHDFARSCTRLDALPIIACAPPAVSSLAATLRGIPHTILTLDSRAVESPFHILGAWRSLAAELHASGIPAPLWIRNTPSTAIQHHPSFLSRLLEASILTGALLCDGLGDLVSIETEPDLARATRLAYNVLQGAGARISKTEFVACPSCGRTLFDLQSTTQRIRAQTGHLKGVKIAIMGCIVNGPGEMADADFGYVGGMPGRINLYVGKQCVQYNIPADEADQRLIQLIRAHGKWIDPEPTPAASATAT